MAGGFAILAWVREDSPLLTEIAFGNQDHTRNARHEIKMDLLRDFATLLGIRWNMDITIKQIDGDIYAYGCNQRFTVSNSTLRNAIGDLADHVDFLRSSPDNDADNLIRYKLCKAKWNVPDIVTETTSSGWERQEPQGTSNQNKRKRI